MQHKNEPKPKSPAHDRWHHRVLGTALLIAVLVVLLIAILSMILAFASQLSSLDPQRRNLLILLLVAVIAPLVASYLFVAPPRFRYLQLAATSAVICLFVSFAIGLLFGVTLRSSNATSIIRLKDNQPPIRASLLDRGNVALLVTNPGRSACYLSPGSSLFRSTHRRCNFKLRVAIHGGFRVGVVQLAAPMRTLVISAT
jgi:hypothetical protein